MVRNKFIDLHDSAKKRFYGYVDFGNRYNTDEERTEAKEALVFLVNAVNDRFKIPVAYFL